MNTAAGGGPNPADVARVVDLCLKRPEREALQERSAVIRRVSARFAVICRDSARFAVIRRVSARFAVICRVSARFAVIRRCT